MTDEPENPKKHPAAAGGPGELQLLTDPHHRRADARLAARILALGVMSEEQAAALLRGGARMAADAVTHGRTREYAAAMKILLAAAKLELEHARIERDIQPAPERPEPPHTPESARAVILAAIDEELARRRALGAVIDEDDDPSAAIEDPPPASNRQGFSSLADRPVLDGTCPPSPCAKVFLWECRRAAAPRRLYSVFLGSVSFFRLAETWARQFGPL